jgi:hypothetical protein
MAWWGVIKHAPWGEIAKAASRVPDFVRELRKPGGPTEPARPATSTPVPDAEQLKFEIELVKSNVDRLRAFSETQSAAMDAQSKALAASFDAISSRIRTLSWLVAAALAASLAALAIVLVR